jgi:hypothetical protein
MILRHSTVACLLLGSIYLAQTRDGHGAPRTPLRSIPSEGLRAPGDFAVIADRAARSRALFIEASRVLLHPRCRNCHPSGDTPLQGMDSRPHDPPAVRGPDNRGVVGMTCTGCHQDGNQTLARVPGAPKWALAPIQMAWVGKSPRQICEQLKDPRRNGARTLDAIAEHNAHDELVAWGWAPGADREPAPGSQLAFAALFRAWIDTGAVCPQQGEQP